MNVRLVTTFHQVSTPAEGHRWSKARWVATRVYICCSKIILDEPDQNDDQVLIDKAIAARRREIAARNNRVHCNVARTESLQFDEKSII